MGDRFDPALAQETERNLRALPFIRRADVSVASTGPDGVDVVVRTYDAWTLEVAAGYKRAGGSTSVKAGLSEGNILGEGKALSGVYSRDGTAESRDFTYRDIQFLHVRRLQYSMSAVSAPGTKTYALALARPFYATIAPNSYGVSATHSEGAVTTYVNGAVAGAVTRRTGEAELDYGVAVATSTRRTRRLKLGLLAHHADFSPLPGQAPGPVPNREQMFYVNLGAEWEQQDFITVRRIQTFTRDEDYNLGLGVFPVVAWAPAVRDFGSTGARFNPGVTVSKGFTWADQLMFLKSGYSSTYVNGGNRIRILSFDSTYYVRGFKYQTFAFHGAADLGWHLDPAAPLVLGEVNGLRGYGLSQFSGSRRLLFNAEDRLYVYDDLWRIVDVGTVLFFDTGRAWPSSEAVRLSGLRSSVGLGLRLAPSRSGGNNPVRIDLAYALNGNGTPSRFSLSILAGQAFP